MYFQLLLLMAFLSYAFYRWATVNNDFFEKRGIPYQKPNFLIGGLKDVLVRKKSFFDALVDIYNESDGIVYGFFEQRNPIIVIRDIDMIKQITVRDFDHFVNHRKSFSIDDALFNDAIFLLENSKWKAMRSTLTPIFTGSKLRQIFEHINEMALITTEHLKKHTAQHKEEGLDIDLKDCCIRFAGDIIASTALGLKVNSFADKTNECYKMGKKVTTFTLWQMLKFFSIANFRPLMKLLGIELLDRDCKNFFTRQVLDTIKYRNEHNFQRSDMIQLLLDTRNKASSTNAKSPNSKLTDFDVVAQCFVYFFGGFDAPATLMCFAAHELMDNPHVQARLFEEIQEVESELNGKPLTYETLTDMKYLNMVVQETQRKWPITFLLDRVCNKDFLFEKDGERIEIKAGDAVWIPICGFHRDPKYFENPEQFDPLRFSDENKENISPFVYMPFGLGPRVCLGNRFILLETKAFLYYLLRDFRIEAAKNTMMPIELVVRCFQIYPKSGFWLKLVPRN